MSMSAMKEPFELNEPPERPDLTDGQTYAETAKTCRRYFYMSTVMTDL